MGEHTHDSECELYSEACGCDSRHTLKRQCDELLEAVTDIHKWLSEFTSTDSDPVAYGHYLGLGHVIAKHRQPQEAPELFPGTLEMLRDFGEEGMKSYAVKYPFVREEVTLFDVEGTHTRMNWRPGTHMQVDDEGYGGTTYAEGEGEMILLVIGTYKPPGYPERTFYTRSWRAPDGRIFGKNKLRVTTSGNFKKMLRGFRYEYVLVSDPCS